MKPRFGMRVEVYFFTFVSVFLTVADIVYWVQSHEPTGTTAMALLAVLGALCGFYLYMTGKRTGERPEDRPDAEVEDGAGVLGHFSPGSPWPIGMAFGLMLVMIGFIFGVWMAVIGAIIFMVTLQGLLFEHFVGRRRGAEDVMR